MTRVLAVTARARYPETWLDNLLEKLDLGGDVEVRVLAAKRPKPAFDAEFAVMPPLPKAPKVEPAPRSLGARVWSRVTGSRPAPAPVPEPAPAPKLRERLATWCREDDRPVELAQWADVVVAMDDAACRSVWELGQRVEGTVFVNRAARVREALEAERIDVPAPTPPAGPTAADATMPPIADEPARLLIAPANYAGQAHAWARAVDAHVPGAAAQNFKDRRLLHPYPADLTVDRRRFQGDLGWRRAWREHVLGTYTHVIVEAGLPVLGESVMPLEHVVAELRDAGLRVALLSHGSDARIPSVHAANERWAQYDGMDAAWVRQLEHSSRRNVEVYTSDPGPVFLSTPGLLEFVPNGTWLPLVVDVDRWHSDEPVLERDRPVVAHAPSSKQKGSHHIDPVLADLDAQGLIEYRRVQGVPIEEMPRVFGTADIVIDQFGAADYGVAACEALAAGRTVVSHVSPGVREHVRAETGLEVPILQADPETLRDVVLGLLADREAGRAAARDGRAFVEAVHDGRRSAEVLARWFENSVPAAVPEHGPSPHTK